MCFHFSIMTDFDLSTVDAVLSNEKPFKNEINLLQDLDVVENVLDSLETKSPVIPASWATLFQEHNVLMQSKANMDRRKFNKAAIELLNKTMDTAYQQIVCGVTTSQAIQESPVKSSSLPPAPSPSHQGQNAIEVFADFREKLLTSKDRISETLVQQVVMFINQGLSPLLTADERKEQLQKKTLDFVMDLSPQLSVKVAPIIKSYITRQFGISIEDMLAEINLPEMSLREKTAMYTRMLDNFLNDTTGISFACSNRQLLGRIAPLDLWFLTFFAFVTAKRSRGDSLLMLGLVGKH